ncbi:DUF2510 domain-containing protein [Cellulomonas humilata]|uniref:DUF2510 domain-containing protein n=1 Tax=Cellulomonas humilata TaxID=144055 RepID=UPI0031B64387
MTTPTTGNPPAGWYTDPGDPAGQRWFDGTSWTTHVQAPPAAAPVPVPAPAPVVSQYGQGFEPSTPDAISPEYRFGQADASSRFGYPAAATSRFDYPAASSSPAEASSRFGYSAPAVGGGWIQPVESHYLINPSSDLGDGKNTPARVALLVSILAVLGVPIAAVAGIILSIVGLKRARTLEAAGWEPKGRGRARWALALSILGAVISAFLVANVVRLAMTEATVDVVGYDAQAFETEIAAGISAQTGIATTVQCPDQLVTGAATTFQCVAVDPAGVPTTVTVQTDATGAWTWQLG